jgi:hypothetical protein
MVAFHVFERNQASSSRARYVQLAVQPMDISLRVG